MRHCDPAFGREKQSILSERLLLSYLVRNDNMKKFTDTESHALKERNFKKRLQRCI